MKTQLNDDARELESILDSAFRAAGGVDLARAAQAGDGNAGAARVLDQVGIWDLRPYESVEDGEAAAAVCRAAGRVVLPYPVAERLAVKHEYGVDAVAIASEFSRVNHAALDPSLRWIVVDGDGRRAHVTAVAPSLGTYLGSLVSEVSVGEWEEDDLSMVPLALTLQSWVLLGMMESALDMTRQHLLDRRQFGQPLASFQALQFRFADVVTVFQGFEELAKYALWSVLGGEPGAMVDALACRASALETAEQVFRAGHQMHGAIGFCDEVDLSWLSRHSQPYRRLPWGSSQTQQRLLHAMATMPFAGLYGDGLANADLQVMA